jgi:hypothetical protein
MFTPSELLHLEREMQRALSRAAARLNEVPDFHNPATDTMLREELRASEGKVSRAVEDFGDEPMELFREFLRIWQDFVFEDGPHPFWVMRRVYLFARRYCPEHILEMNGSDLAILLGHTRSNESARLNLLFDRLAGSGVRGARGACGKRQTSRDTFAFLAEGNHNRAKKSDQ